jgi:acetyl esterase/lipase
MKLALALIAMVLFFVTVGPGTVSAAPSQVGDKILVAIDTHLSTNNSVQDIVNHPAFAGFGELLLPSDNNLLYRNVRLDARLADINDRYVSSDTVINALNHLIDEVSEGKTIFYNFYDTEQKQQDPAKKNTGLIFFRGRPGTPFAIVCPGGAFSFVDVLQGGLPIALEINKKGYNVFVIRYRVGGEQVACEDLAAAIAYVFANAGILNIDTKNYSLWGESAGARMAARLASYGPSGYGEKNLPRPVTAVTLSTAHTDFTDKDPATFAVIGELDGIANPETMERRVNAMKTVGIDVEFHKYSGIGHGFGAGIGTVAEGWANDAVLFWEKHMEK